MTTKEIENMPAGITMDALIAEKVLGQKIMGLCRGWYDGGWLVMGEPKGDGEDVFCRLSKCLCDIVEEMEECRIINPKLYGHETSCLEVVPEYSTQIQEAWGLVKGFKGDFELRVQNEICHRATFFIPSQEFEAFADTAPLAICRAILMSCGLPA